MFNFLPKSGMRSPSAAILSALESDSLLPGIGASALGVVQSHGRYSGRKVTYLRVFDAQLAAAQAGDGPITYTYQGLDAHPELVLRAGFVEQDGRVVLYARPPGADAPVPRRTPADRAVHGDVERFIFSETGTTRSQM